MERPIPRSYSDKYVPGQGEVDLFTNKNVEWFEAPAVKLFYVALILLVWGVLHMSGFFDMRDCWTITNMIHGVVTFIIFHWIKGNPDDTSQGEYNAFTLYEQIDAGTAWTSTKKFLMLLPTVLTWFACYAADFKPFYIVVNIAIFLICIIAKMPQMHGVRILGINSTPGIDTPVNVPNHATPSKNKPKTR